MAVYQLGFHGFSQLQIISADGTVGVLSASSFTLGDRLRIAPGPGVLTRLRIEVEAGTNDQALVAPDSPHGKPGAVVGLAARVVVMTDEAVPRQVILHALEIDGVPLGLVGAEPLARRVTYRVVQIAAVADGPRLADLAPAAAPPRDRRPRGRPVQAVVLSLTHGTLIDTPQGPRPIEDLVPGDLVTTLSNGSQPVRWTGAYAVAPKVLQDRPQLRPILIETGALGNQRPLLVSPLHRFLINDWRAQVYFGEDQVLIAAKTLENGGTIRQVLPQTAIAYCQLLFDRHEVILAEGALSESFHPGEEGMALLDPEQRQQIEALFPHLPVGRRRAAFPIVQQAEARALRLPI